ncbi:MAG: FMN-binding protein [Chloroflexi bacterium]|nr:FMN-binding protein [Chloroflexota bacterium]
MFPRRGAIALVTTAMALVLLFNFKTPDQLPVTGGIASTDGSLSASGNTTGSRGSTGSATNDASSGVSSSGTTTARSSAAPSTGTGSKAGTETLTGDVFASRYGSTQVQVTITNGRIISVTALQLPTGGRSGQISQYVEPVLSSEALSAQSANIDIVSGATYTSEAYAQSLQSALDQAVVSTAPAG